MTQLTIQRALELALQHHQAGRLREAEQLCRQILAQQPEHADATHCLGVIAAQGGRHDVAVDLLRRAIALQPNNAESHNNLGKALAGKGQIEEAIAAYGQAIALRPNYAEAHYNLGKALSANGQLEGAIAAYRQAIALRPNYAEAHNNLGNALAAKDRLDEAIATYRQAIVLRPKLPEAHYNLGKALYAKGQLEQALAAYRQSIALRPNFAEAYNNLGSSLRDNGQIDEALTACRQAIALRPSFAESYNNLGNVLRDKGQLDEALAAYRLAIALQPNFAEAHSNLVFVVQYHPDYDAGRILAENRQWASQFAAPLAREIAPHKNDRAPDRRLRVGYVSPDFFLHAVGRFLLPLLTYHDHDAFEIVAYSSVRRGDAMTDRLRAQVDDWQNISGLSDAQAADKVRGDGIDILVDLTLHTSQNRMLLFGRKPAPVQATWLGYVGTTGLAAMDYRLSDPYLDPPGKGDEFYVEKTLRLPHSFWCYPAPDASPQINDLPALSNGQVTFGCFNSFCKMTAPTLELWAALLRQVGKSQLVIYAYAGSHREAVVGRFASAGVEGSRIRFVARQPMQDYFAQYGQIDLALDPFPYGGGTTTCDALWMGVPVVTLAGRTAMGRAGVSLLSNVGLPQLIAQTPEQYLSIARGLAADLPRLAQLRRELRPMMQASKLMDASRFAAEMESAYRQMWVNWCAGTSTH